MRSWAIIVGALRMFAFIVRNPEAVNIDTLEFVAQLMKFVNRVISDGRPYLSSIVILTESEQVPVVSLWAGIGPGAEPIERIQELAAENARLKSIIARSKEPNDEG